MEPLNLIYKSCRGIHLCIFVYENRDFPGEYYYLKYLGYGPGLYLFNTVVQEDISRDQKVIFDIVPAEVKFGRRLITYLETFRPEWKIQSKELPEGHPEKLLLSETRN